MPRLLADNVVLLHRKELAGLYGTSLVADLDVISQSLTAESVQWLYGEQQQRDPVGTAASWLATLQAVHRAGRAPQCAPTRHRYVGIGRAGAGRGDRRRAAAPSRAGDQCCGAAHPPRRPRGPCRRRGAGRARVHRVAARAPERRRVRGVGRSGADDQPACGLHRAVRRAGDAAVPRLDHGGFPCAQRPDTGGDLGAAQRPALGGPAHRHPPAGDWSAGQGRRLAAPLRLSRWRCWEVAATRSSPSSTGLCSWASASRPVARSTRSRWAPSRPFRSLGVCPLEPGRRAHPAVARSRLAARQPTAWRAGGVPDVRRWSRPPLHAGDP